jgi:hypothetical protein
VQFDPIDTVYWIGKDLTYKPQISHSLVGFFSQVFTQTSFKQL